MRDIWAGLWARLHGDPQALVQDVDNALPLRAELYGADQMEQHGTALAGSHRLSAKRAPDQLLGRLGENEAVLLDTSRLLTGAIKIGRRISPAGEWLLDNFYLIEEQIRTARRHLPKGYSRELLRLANSPSAGRPRVYDIALEAISHGDGRVDPENLSRFVAAYQKSNPLTLGELWAIPIMLRLALIENLRRVAALVATSTRERSQADAWADLMMEASEKDPKNLILVVADMARSDPPMKSAFVAELARRLQGQSAALALPLSWIEQRLSESGITIEQQLQSEARKQASAQVSISNSIGSLRFLGATDWRAFVETMSGVEHMLREDPDGVYASMDFATRDSYRHAVEKKARQSGLSEIEVARKAVQLALEGAAAAKARGASDEDAQAGRVAHVGYYLIGSGLPTLERAIVARLSVDEAMKRACRRFPLLPYLGSIALLTLLLAKGLLEVALDAGLHGWTLAPLVLVCVLSVSRLAVALVNWGAMLFAAPRRLPRLDFSAGIPPGFRTLVVVPAMLFSARNIAGLVEALEVRFLANRDAHLQFALLTDYTDADAESLPEDQSLLQEAAHRIGDLNRKYGNPQVDVFFLFHRPRRWNPSDKRWMGYERKRGKLADLNALLRGGGPDKYSLVVGRTEVLSGVRYVITLDTDTQLPRESARQFAATMAHPLNRPHFDAALHRVTSGYGILQPRVAASLPSARQSLYSRLLGSEPGIDPYTLAVSDVYQDLFAEGSYIGKGIYDVDAFERALRGQFPENRILSHDLLEGCYARAGLLSDVQLFEEHPAGYSADVARRHRWIRGDWQIATWMLSRLPWIATGASRDSRTNRLSTLSQWKIFDNLRRSLVPAGLVLLLLLGWMGPTPAWLWTLAAIGIITLPVLIASGFQLLVKPEDVPAGQHRAATLRATGTQLLQAGFAFACLPHEAYYSLDAIIRTNWRILVAQKRLLEWKSSGSLEGNHHDSLASNYLAMWSAPVLAIASAGLLASSPPRLAAAAPVLLLWFAAPAIAWWLSRRRPLRAARLSDAQTVFLRDASRKTWAFFETFVGPADHWLPPDNFQEHPAPVIAHRTSPTNIGLSLLANLSAVDFGYISAGQFVGRTSDAMGTMGTLERHRGHFYNWYDTQTLKPLQPRYISSVDSGNLAGHLLTLRAGLQELRDHKVLGTRLFDGLADTQNVLVERAADVPPAALLLLDGLRSDMACADDARPWTLAVAHTWLTTLERSGALLAASLKDTDPAAIQTDAHWWAEALARQCRGALDELNLLVPWISSPTPPGRLRDLVEASAVPTLRDLADQESGWMAAIELQLKDAPQPEEQAWLEHTRPRLAAAAGHARRRIAEIERLAGLAEEFSALEYDFLYDKTRRLLAIGYNVSEHRQDSSYYDLLASEARLSSFVAIAQGKLPQESWFALGRLLTSVANESILVSWSGSMFEYLMPMLVMPTYENTLLDETCRAAVRRQISYARQRGVAWGISESGYNAVDASLNYQYRAFGVPGLGLKRGLAEDLVIAPYASALALMVAPEAACENLQRLAAEGVEGRYGFFEAVDHTASRLPHGKSSALIRSFMAHHQGMVLLSLAYVLLDRPMQRRFVSDPSFRATTLLLQERLPTSGGSQVQGGVVSTYRTKEYDTRMPVRTLDTWDTPIPEVQLLSNGRYTVMVTNAGGGYSRWKDLAVSRWREDTTRDNWGTFCYIRDLSSGTYWSNTHQPTLNPAKTYQAIFSEGRAEFRRRDLDFETHTEIVVSPEDDIEMRRVRITNRARTRREIDVTSYSEVVLAAPPADAAHPAFSNLFVQTEIIRARNAIVCTRRPRSIDERTPWMFHLMTVRGAATGEVSYETDRMRFIGREHSVAAPQAMREDTTLSGTDGSVLDPIVAIRTRITLEPEQTAIVDMVYGIGENRDAASGLAGKYQDRHLADRVFELAWTHSQVVLGQINATEAEAQLYARLASSIVYANPGLRADAAVLRSNRRGQSGLWGYAISGDLPIVLLQIGDQANIELVRQLVRAHAYWRLKGLSVDLVIWNEERAGYRQQLQEQITGLIAAGVEGHVIDRPGGIFVRPADQISDEDRTLVQSVARAILSDRRGTLDEQVARSRFVEKRIGQSEATIQHPIAEKRAARLIPTGAYRPASRAPTAPQAPSAPQAGDLLFHNGLGGFTPDGREYVITTSAGRITPAPWVNVLANPQFGTVVSESGAAYSWSENAHEFRLTPWGNDPVGDPSGEAFYLRDEKSGHFWSPAPSPCRGTTPYVSRHGFGYSVFEHTEDGIRSELTIYVAIDAAIKFSVLKVRNESGRARRLSATGYVEWVLGDLRQSSAMHVVTEIDTVSGAFHARNPYSTAFSDRVAFFDVDDPNRSASGDRARFIGRNGTLANPAAMSNVRLSYKAGAALDPCAALQSAFALGDGEERELVFRLGAGRDLGATRELLARFHGSAAARDALDAVKEYWQRTLGALQVETPDPALDVLTNGWLVYQTVVSRLWGRSGFYQSGGAYGFRDQLQDAMALVHTEPGLMRAHLLRCAARQFPEGDVQHWWHPRTGRGVRTRCSDDFLWMPLATCRYVASCGDTGVLDEIVPFIEGRTVGPDEDSYYDLPVQSEESATLYQHCVRAIERGLRFGEHGLPLMGSGDWNDGMNMVGEGGKGESVWLAFFMVEVLTKFSEISAQRKDASFAERCRHEAAQLRSNVQRNGWDGQWYLRAYFDDGSPLGSAGNPECQIDSLPQSWAVLSGADDPARSRMAMAAVDRRLVKKDQALIQVLDPPFDKSGLNPGYIKGYVPGVRENGGQYTHAAIWTVMAFAALGDHERAWALFDMINPVNHGRSEAAIATYKVEPYVVAADVYAVAPHIGRGGWTWYTGSAGWMYRLILESLLGLTLEVDKLRFAPCLPGKWESFKVRYRYGENTYHINVVQTPATDGKTRVSVDGIEQKEDHVPLVADQQDHTVEVRIPRLQG